MLGVLVAIGAVVAGRFLIGYLCSLIRLALLAALVAAAIAWIVRAKARR